MCLVSIGDNDENIIRVNLCVSIFVGKNILWIRMDKNLCMYIMYVCVCHFNDMKRKKKSHQKK